MHDYLFNFKKREDNIELEQIKSTIGIEYSTLNISDGSQVSVWDFAGQLEYTVTHQYFLSSKVCFLCCEI